MVQNKNFHFAQKANLHTHSWYCGHGVGELSDYVKKAKSLGFTALGFSEHAPLPDQRWSSSRMYYNQLNSYMEECRALQKNEKELQILCGFECDHHNDYINYYKDNLLGNNFADYLALAIHYFEDSNGHNVYAGRLPSTRQWLHRYTDAYIEGLQSGLYAFGVHPDLFGMFYTKWDQEAIACSKSIIECATELAIPLEINANGLRKSKVATNRGKVAPYPLKEFWALATHYDLPIIMNSDAHSPSSLDLSKLGVYEMVDSLNIELSGWLIEQNKDNSFALQAQKPTKEAKVAISL